MTSGVHYIYLVIFKNYHHCKTPAACCLVVGSNVQQGQEGLRCLKWHARQKYRC
jgi:hypothetical protein